MPLSEMVSVQLGLVSSEFDSPVLVAFEFFIVGQGVELASLLIASLALLINLRRKISLCEYSECVIK